MSFKKLAISLLFVVLPVLAQAAPAVTPIEPPVHPEWSYVRVQGERLIKTTLYDPASAQFEWTSGFAWSSIKRPLGRTRWAWVACVNINAKNQYGGYVGAQPYWVAFFPEDENIHVESVTVAMTNAATQCDSLKKFPLQPELLDVSVSPATSVADEISKLAILLERGLITRGEFDSQKLKLLDAPN